MTDWNAVLSRPRSLLGARAVLGAFEHVSEVNAARGLRDTGFGVMAERAQEKQGRRHITPGMSAGQALDATLGTPRPGEAIPTMAQGGYLKRIPFVRRKLFDDERTPYRNNIAGGENSNVPMPSMQEGGILHPDPLGLPEGPEPIKSTSSLLKRTLSNPEARRLLSDVPAARPPRLPHALQDTLEKFQPEVWADSTGKSKGGGVGFGLNYDIPFKQHGGVVSDEAIVGESGPEHIKLRPDGSVKVTPISRSTMKSLLRRGKPGADAGATLISEDTFKKQQAAKEAASKIAPGAYDKPTWQGAGGQIYREPFPTTTAGSPSAAPKLTDRTITAQPASAKAPSYYDWWVANRGNYPKGTDPLGMKVVGRAGYSDFDESAIKADQAGSHPYRDWEKAYPEAAKAAMERPIFEINGERMRVSDPSVPGGMRIVTPGPQQHWQEAFKEQGATERQKIASAAQVAKVEDKPQFQAGGEYAYLPGKGLVSIPHEIERQKEAEMLQRHSAQYKPNATPEENKQIGLEAEQQYKAMYPAETPEQIHARVIAYLNYLKTLVGK